MISVAYCFYEDFLPNSRFAPRRAHQSALIPAARIGFAHRSISWGRNFAGYSGVRRSGVTMSMPSSSAILRPLHLRVIDRHHTGTRAPYVPSVVYRLHLQSLEGNYGTHIQIAAMAVAYAAWRVVVVLSVAIETSSQSASADADGQKTATPIKHVIVLIGENRTFDHVFATYVPQSRDSVANLLSKGIVNADGTPGPKAANRAVASTDSARDLSFTTKRISRTLSGMSFPNWYFHY